MAFVIEHEQMRQKLDKEVEQILVQKVGKMVGEEMGVSRQAIHQRVQNIRKIIDKKWLKFA